MHGLADLRSMEHMMGQLVGSRESLSVRVVQRVHSDDAHAILDIGHAGEVLIERCILKDDSTRLDYPLDRDRWRRYAILPEDRTRRCAREIRIGIGHNQALP